MLLYVYRKLYTKCIDIFLSIMYIEKYIHRRYEEMQNIYITAFQSANSAGRKEILNAVWEGLQSKNKKEKRRMKKVWDGIKEILFQEGKRPM